MRVRKENRSSVVATLRVALVALVAGATPVAGAEEGAESAALELKVRQQLLEKLGVDGMRVEVRAAGGLVLLGGTVKKRETAELAEGVAQSVPGVSRVENEIQLAAYLGSTEKAAVAASETERELRDAGLQSKVRFSLVDRLGTDGFRIGIDAAGETVTLEFPQGMSAERRRDAVEIARGVGGVEKVIELEKR
jgi:osmotically-inducible protein OsmY